jgi:hypothetical protein
MRLLSLGLLALLVTSMPSALAQIDTCTVPSPNSVGPNPTDLVLGSQATRDFTYAAPCWSVVAPWPWATGPIPPCTSGVGGNSGVLQWCSTATYVTGQWVMCSWRTTALSTIFDYAIGVDANGDGNLYFGSGEVAFTTGRPLLPAGTGTYYISFIVPPDWSGNNIAGPLIAYPVSMSYPTGGSPLDMSWVTCV